MPTLPPPFLFPTAGPLVNPCSKLVLAWASRSQALAGAQVHPPAALSLSLPLGMALAPLADRASCSSVSHPGPPPPLFPAAGPLDNRSSKLVLAWASRPRDFAALRTQNDVFCCVALGHRRPPGMRMCVSCFFLCPFLSVSHIFLCCASTDLCRFAGRGAPLL